MKNMYIAAASLCLAVAQNAYAQDAPSGFYYSGFAQFEYYDLDIGSENMVYGDATIGFASGPGAGLAVGAEIALETLYVNSDMRNIWNPILYLDTGFGRLSLGAPKSVADTYGLRNSFSKTGIYTRSLWGFPSMSNAKFFTILIDEPLYGLRYDNDFGNTKLGASYHRYSKGAGDVDFWAAGLRHSFGDIDVFATYERVAIGSESTDNYSAGAEGKIGAFSGGISYNDGAQLSTGLTSLNAYLDYDVSDRFTIGAEAAHISYSGSGSTFYTLNADYDIWKNAYVGLSYADSVDLGDPAYIARIGWKF